MKYKRILGLAVLLCLGIGARAQETPDEYNPFVPANLDDENKLPVTPVVESSYHRYQVQGDMHYLNPSTFVWYVYNGTLGTYDPATDTWVEAVGTIDMRPEGESLELAGLPGNMSEIWVRWNDGSGGNTGYIAVYERSSSNCIVTDQISGYKHVIQVPPEIWFLADAREECSFQDYAVTVQFNELHSNSFPYSFMYSYPGSDGVMTFATVVIEETDLDAALQYIIDLPGIDELDATVDEDYIIGIDVLRDKFGSVGKIAPLGPTMGQFGEINLTILHLPQTGGMTMD